MSLPPPLQNNIVNTIQGSGGLQGVRAGTNITLTGNASFPTINSTGGGAGPTGPAGPTGSTGATGPSGVGTTTSSNWVRDTNNVVLNASLQNLNAGLVFTPTQTGFAVIQVDIFFQASVSNNVNVDSYLLVNGVNQNLGSPFRTNTTGNTHYFTCDFSWRIAVVGGTPYTLIVQANTPGQPGGATKDDITISAINTA